MPSAEFDHRTQRQLERLQSTLNRAFRSVPFHQDRLKRNGIHPQQVETIADLADMPFMTRRHLGENYPYGLFAVPLRDIVRIHTAPGTTLNPSVSGYTAHDLRQWTAMVAESLAAAGVGNEDILQISLDPGLNDWGRDYKLGAEALGASVIPNSLLSIEKQLMVLRDYRTTTLVTTPAYAAQIADHVRDLRIAPDRLALSTLILVGEPVPGERRRHLEDSLGVTTWLHYGLSEVPGPALAYECRQHEGLHVHDEHFLVEIIDPDTGRWVGPGTEGELVLTSLTTRAMPLIRFRTGDRVRRLEGPCACGNPTERVAWLTGRTDDLMVLRGVKIDRAQVLAQITSALAFAPDLYRVFVNTETNRRFLEVWIGVDDRIFSDEIKMLEKRMVDIGQRLYECLGVPVTVRLKERDTFDAIEA
ncbi:MAG: AMP-binding protein [Desulfobacterales bacterium]|jgi:phenylacetate-CoA ligase|nr:AMP-binding protein [Desulfobacterales bacterium]